MSDIHASDHVQPGVTPLPIVTDEAYDRYLASLADHPDLQGENVRLGSDTAAKLGVPMLAIGVAGLAATLVGAFVSTPAHAVASFGVGVWSVLGPCLGCLALVMIFHLLNTQWSVTIRRTAEQIAGAIWVPLVGLATIGVVELISGGVLLDWLGIAAGEDYLLDKKSGYLNPAFFAVRVVAYVVVLIGLATMLRGRSVQQDLTGDRQITRRLRFSSTWAMPLYVATLAFMSMDFLMTPDHHFFSTMWPVYIFGGAALGACALIAVVTGMLRLSGKLNRLVTKEHFHDLGKLKFAFVCFWAYVAFSQYFLIWYGNIPEETNWFLARKEPIGETLGWLPMTYILPIGGFLVPLVLLVSRVPKKNTLAMIAFGVYLLVFRVLDLSFVLRPVASWEALEAGVPLSSAVWWVDAAAVVGCWGVFGFFLLRALASAALVPIRDPRLGRCMQHRNWV